MRARPFVLFNDMEIIGRALCRLGTGGPVVIGFFLYGYFPLVGAPLDVLLSKIGCELRFLQCSSVPFVVSSLRNFP